MSLLNAEQLASKVNEALQAAGCRSTAEESVNYAADYGVSYPAAEVPGVGAIQIIAKHRFPYYRLCREVFHDKEMKPTERRKIETWSDCFNIDNGIQMLIDWTREFETRSAVLELKPRRRRSARRKRDDLAGVQITEKLLEEVWNSL